MADRGRDAGRAGGGDGGLIRNLRSGTRAVPGAAHDRAAPLHCWCHARSPLYFPASHSAPRTPVTDLLDRLRSALGERYAIERQIGEGGMATVYRAKDLSTSARSPSRSSAPSSPSPLGADRFLREIRVAAKLQHPNILGALRLGRGRRAALLRHAVHRGRILRTGWTGSSSSRSTSAIQLTAKWPTHCSTPTSAGSSTATSSPRTSCFCGGHALVADFGIARAVS